MKTPLTPERLAGIAARFEAARPKEDRGGEELKMTVLPMKTVGTRIHYADNDLAAIIYGNLGLDVEEYGLAKFLAHALLDVRDLLEEIERCEKLKKLHDDLTKLLSAAEGDDLVRIVRRIIHQKDMVQQILK